MLNSALGRIGITLVLLGIVMNSSSLVVGGTLLLAIDARSPEAFTSKPPQGRSASDSLHRYQRTANWRKRFCKEVDGELKFVDGTGAILSGTQAQKLVGKTKLGKGCEKNPCSPTCALVNK